MTRDQALARWRDETGSDSAFADSGYVSANEKWPYCELGYHVAGFGRTVKGEGSSWQEALDMALAREHRDREPSND